MNIVNHIQAKSTNKIAQTPPNRCNKPILFNEQARYKKGSKQ